MPRKTELEKHAARGFKKFKRAVGEQAKRGVRAAGRAASRYVRSGALTRDVELIGGSGPAAAVRAFTGHGDYGIMNLGRGIHPEHTHVSGYVMKGRGSRSHPHMSLEKGEMIISHSEYIGEMVSSGTSGAFTSQAYGINPGNSGTFPWLAYVANNFQDYQFEKLIFEYKPLVSEASSSSNNALLSMGSVIMATQYDSLLGPYSNKAQMENSDFAVSCKPSEHCQMAVECQPKYNPLGVLYISPQLSGTVSSNGGDIRMQNLGLVQVACVGVPTASSAAIDLGEIWVHYTVRLMKPTLAGALGAILSSHYSSSGSTGTCTGANPFGTAVTANIQPQYAVGSLLNLTFTTTTFTFPLAITEGSYLVVCYWIGSSNANACVVGNPSIVNGTILQVWSSNASTDAYTVGDAPQTTLAAVVNVIQSFVVSVNAPGSALCVVTLNNTTLPAGAKFDMFITPYNDDIVA